MDDLTRSLRRLAPTVDADEALDRYVVRPFAGLVRAGADGVADLPTTDDEDARQRSTIIEPRFGQIKQHEGFRRWTVWGLEGVKTQWSLLCATLNLRILYRRWRANPPPQAADPLAQAQRLPKATKWSGWRNFVIQTWEKRLAPALAHISFSTNIFFQTKPHPL